MIRVMVVDDSPLVRKIAADILQSDPLLRVTSTAASAEFALNKLQRENPDVITMDIEMPGIGGLEAIRQIMATRPTPIIVLSAHARRGAELTLQALEAGAVDFVLKPSVSLSGGLDAVARELVEKVKAAYGTRLPRGTAPAEKLPPPGETATAPAVLVGGDGHRLVAIGTSTGGPVALKTVLSGLPASFPLPLVAVQHMPPVFTRAFAERLNALCRVEVKEAEEGDALLPGRVLIAPGDYHMIVLRSAPGPRVSLHRRELVSGHRPSVDVLLGSVVREYGRSAIGVIMTGMGRDGAEGMRQLRLSGGLVLAQDSESSVIYGMNREVILNGDAHRVLPLEKIAETLVECSSQRAGD